MLILCERYMGRMCGRIWDTDDHGGPGGVMGRGGIGVWVGIVCGRRVYVGFR